MMPHDFNPRLHLMAHDARRIEEHRLARTPFEVSADAFFDRALVAALGVVGLLLVVVTPIYLGWFGK